ncbi:targeting protein for Xklp2-like [Prorops nasuta]|uniref:targeting protein for Xklp2-like n=1 Tax=Prorops nasuta TaxID=863751 RepID=UPI0034CF14D3
MMDECIAPQWTDLTSSPQQLSDDYFEKVHKVHEPMNLKVHHSDLLIDPADQSVNELSILKMTPIKAISPKTKHNQSTSREISLNEVLREAVENLEHFSKKSSKSQNLINQSASNNSTFKTPKSLIKAKSCKSVDLHSKSNRTTRCMSNKKNMNTRRSAFVMESSNAQCIIDSTVQPLETLPNSDSIQLDKKLLIKRTQSKSETTKLTSSLYNRNETSIENSIQTFNMSLRSKSKINSQVKENLKEVEVPECNNYTPSISSSLECKNDISANIPIRKCKSINPFKSTLNEKIKAADNNKKTRKSVANTKSIEFNKMSDGNDFSKKSCKNLYSLKKNNNDCSNNDVSSSIPVAELEDTDNNKTNTDQKTNECATSKNVDIKAEKNDLSIKDKASSSVSPKCTNQSKICYPYRRQSLKFKPPNQYISLAEAVSKFQCRTPKRFRSVSNKNRKPDILANVRRHSLKLTVAVSPALMSKTRVRPTTALSQEKREQLELEEIKKHQIKANPLKPSILKSCQPLKKAEKKPVTIPEPFHLTEVKKHCQKPEKHNHSNHNNELHQTKAVKTVVTTNDNCITVAEEKVLYFGVPLKTNKKITHTLPFNFEMRNKDFQMKKEQKLKELQVQEQNKIKSEFHAKPVPTFCRQLQQSDNGKDKEVNKPVTVCPFSFEERNKQLLKKKEELLKQASIEDKKARVFHAQPVPDFKPVLVRGRSRENIKAKNNTLIVVKKPASSCSKLNDYENKNPNVTHLGNIKQRLLGTKPKIAPPKLETDKRAKERRQFDEKLRQKELEDELKRQQEEERNLEEEKKLTAVLRKQTETKARPMPVFKPRLLEKSTKPLTNPQSPMWSSKIKKVHDV